MKTTQENQVNDIRSEDISASTAQKKRGYDIGSMPKIDKSSGLVENVLSNVAEGVIEEVKKNNQTISEDKVNWEGLDNKMQSAYQPIPEDKVNWDELKLLGISKENLSEKSLKNLLNYGKSELTPVAQMYIDKNNQEQFANTTAKLSLHKTDSSDPNSTFSVRADFRLNKELSLEKYFDHEFTDKEKFNLINYGNAGNEIEIKFHPNKEPIKLIVGVDKDLNKLVSVRADKVRIQKEIFGVTLSDAQKNALKTGKPLKIEGMISPRTGKPFFGMVSYSPEKNQIQMFRVPQEILDKQKILNMAASERKKAIQAVQKDEYGVPLSIYNHTLTDEQRTTMRLPQGEVVGSSIKLENLVDEKGASYSTYVRLDKKNKNGISFSRDGQFTKKQTVGIDQKNQIQVASNNEGHKTNEQIKKGISKLESGATAPKPTQKADMPKPKRKISGF